MNPVNPGKHGEERIGLAAQRVSDLLAMADVLGTEIGLEDVREAALVHLEPASEWFAAWTLNLALSNVHAAALVLAGQAPDDVITKIMAGIDSMEVAPARRPRRTRRDRGTRRDRAAERDRRATKFLNGEAWRIVGNPNAPDVTEGP